MIATGVAKQVRYKSQPTWATLPGASGAQLLRRVSSDLNKKKGTFESNEITSTLQRRDYRHGLSSVEGSINGELSPGTWKDFLAMALRRDATTVTAITAASITVAGSGPTYTITRAAGSFLTDGIKAGMVVRLTAGAFTAGNLNKNLVVVSVVALVLTVMVLNGSALVAEGPIGSATVSVPGKINYVPQTGHTDKMIAVEHWYSDLGQSEVFDSLKLDDLGVTIAPSGMVTIANKLLGRDMLPASSAYYTTPTAETTSGLLAGPQGIMIAAGAGIATLTGLNFSIKGGMKGEQVIGSTTFADITEGRVLVDGQMTALFDGVSLRDLFYNETEASVIAVLASSPAAAAEFMSFTLPRVKLGGADRDDGDKSIVQTLPFTALENTAGGAGTSSEATTFWTQDSLG